MNNATRPPPPHRPLIAIARDPWVMAGVVGLAVFLLAALLFDKAISTSQQTPPPPTPPAVVAGFEAEKRLKVWDPGQSSFADQVVLTSREAGDLRDCRVFVSVTYDDASSKTVQCYWGSWAFGGEETIDFPASPRAIERVRLDGSATRADQRVELSFSRSWGTPSRDPSAK